MNDSIEEQLKKLAAEKEANGEESEITEMIENSVGRDETEEQMRIVTSDEDLNERGGETAGNIDAREIFSGGELEEYVSKNNRSKRTFERYKEGIENEIDQSGAESTAEIIQAVNLYFKKNPNHRKSQAGKLILSNVLLLEQAGKEGSNDPTEKFEGNKMEGEEPKNIEEFEKLGFKISNDSNKTFYNNENTGVDLEITGYDPKTNEVVVVLHEHSKIENQEDGQNVLVLDGGEGKIRTERIAFNDFKRMMDDYVLQGSQIDATVERAQIEDNRNFEIKAVPGKMYRNKAGNKIKVIEFNPLDKKSQQVRAGQARICMISPNVGSKPSREFKTIGVDELNEILAKQEYREVNPNIKVGGRNTVWRKGNQTMEILRHEKDKSKGKHLVVFRREDGSGGELDLGDFKELINSENWQRQEKQEKSKQKGKQIEKLEEGELNENEKRLFEEVFVPFAEDSAKGIEKPVWADGYSADQRNQLKEIERKRFWEQEIFEKIEEFNQKIGADTGKAVGIREEKMGMFVEKLKNEIDKKIKPVVETDESVDAKVEQEKIEKQQINEQEKEKVERIFVPYSQIYLEEISSYSPEGLDEEEIEQVRKIEKDRFFGSVLPLKMEESTFIRKQAVSSAVDSVKETIEKEQRSDSAKN